MKEVNVTHDAAAQEEVVLVHVELAGRLQDLGAHVEREEQLVPLKQTAAREPKQNQKSCIIYI